MPSKGMGRPVKKAAPKKTIGRESAYVGANRQDPISKLRRTVGNATGINKKLVSKGFKPLQDQSQNPLAKRSRKYGLETMPEKQLMTSRPVKKAAVKKANKPVVKKAAPKKAAAPARKVSTRKPPAPKNYGKGSGGSRSTTRRASY